MRYMIIVFGLAAWAFGLVMYWFIGADQRTFDAKLQSIHDGKVPPESLSVIRKYINSGMHGHTYPHVLFRSSRDPKLNLATTHAFYDSVDTKSKVTAYYFRDGYFVPQSQGDDANRDAAKWFFLGVGGSVGTVLLLVGFLKGRTNPEGDDSNPRRGSVQDFLAAIRDRGKEE